MPRKSKVTTSWKKKGPVSPLSSVKYDYKKPHGLSEAAQWIEPATPKTAAKDLKHYRDYYCPHVWDEIAIVRHPDHVKTISNCKHGCGAIKVQRKKA